MIDLAATWCSIFACDRARAAWGIKLQRPFRGAMRLAWIAFEHAKAQHPQWTRAEQWADTDMVVTRFRDGFRGTRDVYGGKATGAAVAIRGAMEKADIASKERG